jgi:outer membrane protein assembly factor BamB
VRRIPDMRRTVLLMFLFVSALSTFSVAADEWPMWRGPLGTGVAPSADPPVQWSESKNVKWKIEIPGRGSSSPAIWGDRIFLLTAIPAGVPANEAHKPRGGINPRITHQFKVLAINRADGKVVWERTAREEVPHEASHQDNGTWASSSAVTDGQHVIASFESRGIFCYDMNGTLGVAEGSWRQAHAQ